MSSVQFVHPKQNLILRYHRKSSDIPISRMTFRTWPTKKNAPEILFNQQHTLYPNGLQCERRKDLCLMIPLHRILMALLLHWLRSCSAYVIPEVQKQWRVTFPCNVPFSWMTIAYIMQTRARLAMSSFPNDSFLSSGYGLRNIAYLDGPSLIGGINDIFNISNDRTQPAHWKVTKEYSHDEYTRVIVSVILLKLFHEII